MYAGPEVAEQKSQQGGEKPKEGEEPHDEESHEAEPVDEELRWHLNKLRWEGQLDQFWTPAVPVPTFVLITRGINPNSIRDVVAMCANNIRGVFCHNRRNFQALDALVTDRAWYTTIWAARQYHFCAFARECSSFSNLRQLMTKRKFGEKKRVKSAPYYPRLTDELPRP